MDHLKMLTGGAILGLAACATMPEGRSSREVQDMRDVRASVASCVVPDGMRVQVGGREYVVQRGTEGRRGLDVSRSVPMADGVLGTVTMQDTDGDGEADWLGQRVEGAAPLTGEFPIPPGLTREDGVRLREEYAEVRQALAAWCKRGY